MIKNELHPSNRHRDRYDFKKLIKACPELGRFVAVNRHGDESIDFANPDAVKTLNRAILKEFYNISDWDIPPKYLCPPIPGRADYIHYAADLLALGNDGIIPEGKSVRILDIGVGANCVYPLIGQREYGWSFVGTDIDPKGLVSAEKILEKNPDLKPMIELRLQKTPTRVFESVLKPTDVFDLTICNPPFHSSLAEATAGSRRKWTGLGKAPKKNIAPVLNFGGIESEIWCEGGELEFILRMIRESARIPTQSYWFTSLVSKDFNLPPIDIALEEAGVKEREVIEMFQGQKTSRFVAWTFLTPAQKTQWKTRYSR